MGWANDVSEATLRELAETQADGDTALSLFLDLDPAPLPQRGPAPARSTRCWTPRTARSRAASVPIDDREELRRALEPRASIVADAVREAINQSAEVLALRERPEHGPLGGIAVSLRF
jgi:hypothetical protein